MENRHFLVKLKMDTEAILQTACASQEIMKSIPGAINWGDLHCVRAQWTEDSDGVCGWVVWIEEASPDNWELESYVHKELTKLGWTDLDVHCEW